MCWAQITTVDILGTVKDSSGGVLPGAHVTVKQLATGETRAQVTNASGDYTFTLLPIGTYSVTVKAEGFKEYVASRVTVEAGNKARVDAVMQVGGVSETVQVAEVETAALQTDSATVNTTVSNTEVEDLPMNGRNFINLVQLSPAMSDADQGLSSGNSPDDRRPTSGFSANGQYAEVNNFLLDGMDNNERAIGTVIVKPNLDGLAEIQVQNSLYPASVGRAGGAVVNQITKSGTNAYHGTLYEFLRNDKFDAVDYFATSTPELRQNQFGGSFGGPIMKKKLFFFTDYEGWRQVKGNPTLTLLPSACELGRAECPDGKTQLGDFTDFESSVGVPGNVIPLGDIDTFSQNLANLYPALPSSDCALNSSTGDMVCSYEYNQTNVQIEHSADLRVDYNINANNTFFARYSINNTLTTSNTVIPCVNSTLSSGSYCVPGGGGGGFYGPTYQRAQSFMPSYTHLFSPTLVMQLNAQWLRYFSDAEAFDAGVDVTTGLGGPANLNENCSIRGVCGLASIWLMDGTYPNLGDAFALPTNYVDTGFQYSGNITWTKAAHNIKMGANLTRRDLIVNQQLFKGAYFFMGKTNDFAALLEGSPVFLNRQIQLASPLYKTDEYGIYGQDDWRVNRWLTLNLGARWDLFTPLREKHNHMSNFDPTNAAMLASGQLVVAGQNGVSDTDNFQNQYHDIQPRLGFAATLGHQMVLRGGFGTTYFPDTQASPAFQKNAPYTSTGQYFGPVWTAPPAITADSTCLVASCGNTSIQAVPNGMQLNLKWPIIYMSNLTLEKAFGANLVSAGFIGQYSRHVQRSEKNADMPVPPLDPGGCGDTSYTSLPNPCQPYYSELPLVSSIQLLTGDNSVVNYNAMILQYQRRLEKGLTLSSNYVFTSNLNDTGGPTNICSGCGDVVGHYGRDYGHSDFMIRHRFVLTGSYDLPFGKNLTGVPGVLVKGWALNGIFLYSTGAPFTALDQIDTQDTELSQQQERMNLVQGSSNFHRSNKEWFDISRVQEQTYGTSGNEGRNDFFGPANRHLDFSVFKNFPILETVSAQFRAEAFNITNTPNFAAPNDNVSAYDTNGIATDSGNFGEITSTNSNSPSRQIQFALKLIF
jgi:hypothetical protein